MQPSGFSAWTCHNTAHCQAGKKPTIRHSCPEFVMSRGLVWLVFIAMMLRKLVIQLSKLLVCLCTCRELCLRIMWNCLFTLQICLAVNMGAWVWMFYQVLKKYTLSFLSRVLLTLLKPGISLIYRDYIFLCFVHWLSQIRENIWCLFGTDLFD